MNRRQKGRRNELKAKKILEEKGYIVEIVRGSTKFNKQVDFFGLFDLIALRENDWSELQFELYSAWNRTSFIHTPEKKWIQVKSNRKPAKKLITELDKFKHKYLADDDKVEVWVFHDYKKEPEIIEV